MLWPILLILNFVTLNLTEKDITTDGQQEQKDKPSKK